MYLEGKRRFESGCCVLYKWNNSTILSTCIVRRVVPPRHLFHIYAAARTTLFITLSFPLCVIDTSRWRYEEKLDSRGMSDDPFISTLFKLQIKKGTKLMYALRYTRLSLVKSRNKCLLCTTFPFLLAFNPYTCGTKCNKAPRCTWTRFSRKIFGRCIRAVILRISLLVRYQ